MSKCYWKNGIDKLKAGLPQTFVKEKNAMSGKSIKRGVPG